jgi:hypothetical protein
MVAVMIVLVCMDDVAMRVRVTVCAVTHGLAYTPHRVDQPERQERVTGQIAADSLDCDEPGQFGASQYADAAEQHGAQDMSDAANERYSQGLPQAPTASLAERRKDEIVIRSKHGVQERDRCCRENKDVCFRHVAGRPSGILF